MFVFRGSLSPSQRQRRLPGSLSALAVLPAVILSALALGASTLAGCNAPSSQPSSQPTYVPRDAGRHERRDREDREDRGDRGNQEDTSREGPYTENRAGNGTNDYRNRSSDRDARYDRDDREARSDRDDRDDREPRDNRQNRSRSNAHRALNNTPGQFDFYLLNLSWAPEFCYSHPQAAECTAHAAFVLHGLWPQNNDGTYPESCSQTPGPADPGRYNALYPNPGLLQHEWQTHGTCTGLTPEAYLAAAGRAVHEITIPPTLAHLSAATSMPPDQVLGLFQQSNPGLPKASLALSCGHNFLTAVGVCLDKNLHPEACQQVRSCGATTVRIPAP